MADSELTTEEIIKLLKGRLIDFTDKQLDELHSSLEYELNERDNFFNDDLYWGNSVDSEEQYFNDDPYISQLKKRNNNDGEE